MNFLSIIPSQLGTISQVLISSNGKQIAVANMRGSIGVVLDLDGSASKEVLLTELGDGTAGGGTSRTAAFVTSFCWGEDDKDLYCGDSRGTVSLLQLSMFMVSDWISGGKYFTDRSDCREEIFSTLR